MALQFLNPLKFYNLWFNYPLYNAAESGDTKALSDLISNGANVNTYTWWHHETPLYLAAKKGHTDAVLLLLQNDANPNTMTYYNQESPLKAAVASNHLDTVNTLLNHHADPNLYSSKQPSPLHLACQNQNLGMVKSLVAHGADTQTTTFVRQSYASMGHLTPLMYSLLDNTHFKFNPANTEQVALIEYLLENGSTIDIVFDQVFSRIHTIVYPNFSDKSASGFNIIQTPEFKPAATLGQNALHLAASLKKINAEDAALNNDLEQLEEQLNTHPEWLNAQDNFGLTPLHYLLQGAPTANITQAIELFAQRGADLELEDLLGQTPLFYAAKFNQTDAVQYLLALGANTDQIDHAGRHFHDLNDSLDILVQLNSQSESESEDVIELNAVLTDASQSDVLSASIEHSVPQTDSITYYPIADHLDNLSAPAETVF